MTLLLLQFNNYFNRIVKKYSTIEDYISNSSNYHYTSNTINFNPNDQIVTEQIINWDKTWNPDYLLCIDKDNNICGRWFITKTTRTRGLQYSLSLKRDTVAEKYETIISSPCFVQKGFVNAGNPLIFNKEEFNCNQIKKREFLLNDNTCCSWITLYYNLSQKAQMSGTVATVSEPYINTGAATLQDWVYYTYVQNGYKDTVGKEFKILVHDKPHSGYSTSTSRYLFNANGNFVAYEGINSFDGSLYYDNVTYGYNEKNALIEVINSNKESIVASIGSNWNPSVSLQTLVAFNGKLIKTEDNKFYRIRMYPTIQESSVNNMESNSARTAIENAFKEDGEFKEGWSGNFTNAIQQRITYQKYEIRADEISNGVETFTYDFTSCLDVQDAPYGILCLPYESINNSEITFVIGDVSSRVEKGLSMLIARDLIAKGTGSSGVIYDAQILPYCPIPELVTGPAISLNPLLSGQYTTINDGDNHKRCFALHPYKAKFTKNIKNLISSDLASAGINLNEVKLENQCSFMRLVSPNYNGQYEFNFARNNGINFFNVDCTYKPYQPYIHVNPDFKGLYGSDFNDARGLVCGGDFSLTIVNDAFAQYKLQNKNYNEIFARQIENMDVQHEISMVGQVAQSIAGVGSGAVSGFVTGGGPAGAIAGAAASAVAGAADIALAQKAYKENKDYATDMHEYQLGNIKATPDSLTKVDSFNGNNKIWPVLEYYTCTDEEKEIFRNKITYDGMTINAVGFITNYIGSDRTFIKGQLIILENIDEDNNFAQDIYNEIAKGVYF